MIRHLSYFWGIKMENLLDKVNRIVVKIGTAGITTGSNINKDAIANLAKGAYELREKGKYVTIVTSGAIAAGRRQMQKFEPGSLVDKQTYAAVGQPLLMQEYIRQFGRYNINVAQFLVSKSDFIENDFWGKDRFSSLESSYFNTLHKDIVPIFNENDAVSTDEIQFTDNDELGAFITIKLRQDLMIKLITYDGLLKNGRIVEIASSYNNWNYDNLEREIKEGRGGLQGGLNAAEKVTKAGKFFIMGNAKSNLVELIEGRIIQTRFLPKA